jgi:thioredoxin-like negative regulator of GroEL
MKISRKKRMAGAAALSCLLIGGTAAAADSLIPWRTDASKATAAAAESGKPLMIDVWAIWCEPCKLMEQTTYRDPRIVRTIGDFMPLKVDADANEVFIERYEIDAFPTTLFLDGEGREITRLLSHVKTDVLLETMEQVRDGYAPYLERVQRRDDAAAMRDVADYLIRVDNAARAADLLRRALKIASAAGDTSAETIELELARALLADDRASAAIKVLKRLSTSATTKEVQGKALVALIRAEHDRGKAANADEAMARLRDEFPDLVAAVEP